MSIILGLNAFHADSAACLVVDGKLTSAIAEERLGERLKHSPKFPVEAIRRVLKDAGVHLRDVTHVAIAKDSASNNLGKAKYVIQHPLQSAGAVVEHFKRRRKTSSMLDKMAEICGEDPERVTFESVFVEHHLAHIASSYFLSPFEEATAGLSYDASGDFVSLMAAHCEGTTIRPLSRVFLPHSLGFFYTALCQFIGFDEFGEEYKVMGLAPYGEDAYAVVMNELLKPDNENWFRLNTSYFGMHDGGESGAVDVQGRIKMGLLYRPELEKKLGAPRKRADPLTQREKNIARSCQIRFEDIASSCFQKLHRLVPSNKIALAGGCALNGVMNARLLRESPFTQCYIQPAASDDGTCLGAAYYCYHQVLGQKQRFHMTHAYWGPEYGENEIRLALESSGFRFSLLSDENLISNTAKFIADGKVIGWYQGRSEWGPRALGNRSILANPMLPNMKDLINQKVKRRESFRPFAPSVLSEYADTYFEQSIQSPFMMHVVKLRPEWRDRLPAITHVDGTGRLQTVERSCNPRYYALIEAFFKITNVAMVLNTSFNESEPIVDTPEQALACFRRNDLDALCMGNFFVDKC